MSDYLAFFVGIGIISGVMWLAFLGGKLRTKKMQAVASALGLTFSRVRRGSKTNVLTGSYRDIGVSIYDVRLSTRSGDEFKYTVISMPDAIDAPAFRLFRESIWTREKFISTGKLSIRGHAGFSRMYQLNGKDEVWIKEFFDSKLIEFFEAKRIRKDCTIDVDSGCIDLSFDKLLPASEQAISDLLEYAKDIFDEFEKAARRLAERKASAAKKKMLSPRFVIQRGNKTSKTLTREKLISLARRNSIRPGDLVVDTRTGREVDIAAMLQADCNSNRGRPDQ